MEEKPVFTDHNASHIHNQIRHRQRDTDNEEKISNKKGTPVYWKNARYVAKL
jgi:hypothetical protein